MYKRIGFSIWVFAFVFLCLGCKKQVVSDNHLNVITGYGDQAKENGADLKVKSFEILPLEMTPGSILSDIKQVEVVDSLILVLDQDQLLCFSREGKYKWTYGVKGRGPGEYVRLNTFFVGPDKNTVVLLDEFLKKMITYTLEGEFVAEKAFEAGAMSMVHTVALCGKESLLEENYIFNNLNTIYSLLHLESGKRTELYKLPVRTKNVAMPIGMKPISSFKDTIRMIIPFDNKLYTLQDTTLVPTSCIQTDRELVPHKKLEAIDDFSSMTYLNFWEQGYFLGFKDICETTNYILLNEAGGGNYFLMDKRKNTGTLYSYRHGERLEELPVLGILGASATRFIGSYPNFSLKALLNLIPEDNTNQHLKRFRTTVEALEDDANPCLLFYEFE